MKELSMISTKSGKTNKGLTVRINLFSLDSYIEDFDSEKARLWVKGQAINERTDEKKLFNDAGELVSVLGKWNAAQFRTLRQAKKSA
jgi:hypothetical protein